MGDLFASYLDGMLSCAGAWDEMFDMPGAPAMAGVGPATTDPRPVHLGASDLDGDKLGREVLGHEALGREGLLPRLHYGPLHDVLGTLSAEDYQARCVARDRSFRDQGITFSLSGEQRPFPLDLVPRVVPAAEWEVVERGVVQRVKALEAFLADIYGPGQVFADGVIPRHLVLSSSHFHREAAHLVPPNGARIQVAGIDLVRDELGQYRVLEDNLRTPSGISYVIENRRAMTHVFPELFASYRVQAVADYPAYLLAALRSAAPDRAGSAPTVAVLTPGVHNPAYFEHSFLARQMGVALVEGRDLVCRGGVVFMRTTSGEERVDVIYRRVDDEYLDPVHFRPDSLIGCPGLLNAARAGSVTLANAVGNGVADDKAIYPWVPHLVRYYLGEEPVLANVDTYLLEDPDIRDYVLERLDQLVLKPVDGSGGYGLVIGPKATGEELARLEASVRSNPRGWIAQRVVQLSTSPTYTDEGFEPRHVDLRPFAVNDGNKVWVVPGGLTRVALPRGSLVVNSSQGGGSKDTWVLAPTGDAREHLAARSHQDRRPVGRAATPRMLLGGAPPLAGPGGDFSLQQEQQQQSRDVTC
ncbi:MAG TPA: circularly permuted type 2 ATP-grasp protein [Acidimicrobiales bacterium]|nr:circularly permuted type 2 ATP-grasp protein [Acidimicrobiales bacterium]